MARRNAPAVEARKRRRRNTIIWTAVAAAIVIGLIYKEQVALLYVLATVSVTTLLAIVALTDLHDARRTVGDAPLDDSAALADGPAAATRLRSTQPARAAKRR